MYSKDEASKLRQAFWTTFGQYIAPQPSAEGLKINWINYRTGIKYLYFKMYADNKSAYIAIEIGNPDTGLQQLLFEQFTAYRTYSAQLLAKIGNGSSTLLMKIIRQ